MYLISANRNKTFIHNYASSVTDISTTFICHHKINFNFIQSVDNCSMCNIIAKKDCDI
jgi:hypothetical protein